MLSRIQSFLSRHKGKFIVTGVIFGGAYWASRYVQNALKQYQNAEMEKMLTRTWKQRHYDEIERICNSTIISFSKRASKLISALNDTESLIDQLKLSPDKRPEIFDELKLVAFTKLTLIVYLHSLLVMTIRLNVNLIGGYMYVNGNGSDKSRPVVSNELQGKCLSFYEHLFTTGAQEMNEIIREKVTLVLKDRSLKEKLRLQDLELILWAIHTAITDDARNPCKQLASLSLPRKYQNAPVLPPDQEKLYRKILTETRDLFESDEIISILGSCIKRGFSYFVDNISEFFIERTSEDSSSQTPDTFFAANLKNKKNVVSNVNFKVIPMAKIVPLITTLTKKEELIETGTSSWTQQLILMNDLKTLGANVFECFSD